MQVEQTRLRSGAIIPLVAVISNPRSTTNAKGMEDIRAVVRESANVVHFELRDMADIDEALALFARANPSVLVVNGGDGTIGAVLSAILYRNPFSVIPPIALLPGGKTNMTAADLGVRGAPGRALRRFLAIAQKGEVAKRLVSRNLIELDMGDGSAPKVGTFFGAAGVVKAIYWCREHAYGRGLPNALAHFVTLGMIIPAILGLGKHKQLLISDPMKVKAKGGETEMGQFSVVMASTLDRLLMGLRPFGLKGMGGLKFSLVESGRSTALRALWGLLTGAYAAGRVDGVVANRCDCLEITGTDPVTLDGEIYIPEPGCTILLKSGRALSFIKL